MRIGLDRRDVRNDNAGEQQSEEAAAESETKDRIRMEVVEVGLRAADGGADYGLRIADWIGGSGGQGSGANGNLVGKRWWWA